MSKFKVVNHSKHYNSRFILWDYEGEEREAVKEFLITFCHDYHFYRPDLFIREDGEEKVRVWDKKGERHIFDLTLNGANRASAIENGECTCQYGIKPKFELVEMGETMDENGEIIEYLKGY